ncbi:MAG: hypothetical protein ACK5L7_09575 [Paludibacteraceae bacterium]
MNSILTFLKPAVPKRYLLFIAGCVWAVAGGILLWRGFTMFGAHPQEVWWKLLICIPLGILFFTSIFKKIFKKHSTRILNLKPEKPCAFSFFNWRAYMMMGLMIGFGVFLRTSLLVPVRYLSMLYVIMSIPLCISAVLFFAAGKKYFNILR